MSKLARMLWGKPKATELVEIVLPGSAKIEIQVSSSDVNDEKFTMYGIASSPAHPEVFSWCPLIKYWKENDPLPMDSDEPYMILHKLQRSQLETVSSIYSRYSERHNLKVLVIIASGIHQQHLDKLEDIKGHITVVIVPRHYCKDDLSLYLKDRTKHFKATLRPLVRNTGHIIPILPGPSSECIVLIETIQDIVQNRILVSTMFDKSESPQKLRVLKKVLDMILLLQTSNTVEVAFNGDLTGIVDLLGHDHFNAVFPDDFIFFFLLGYCLYEYYSNFPDNLKALIKKSVATLLKLSSSHVAEHLQTFIDLGRFEVLFAPQSVDIFQLTAKSFLCICGPPFVTHEEDVAHSILLSVSIVIKLYNSCSMLKKTKDIWQKKLINPFKSKEIVPVDIKSFGKGLEAMTVILKGHQELMLSWKDVANIFTSKIHSIDILREFITTCETYLTRNNEAIKFAKDFFHPVTMFYDKKFQSSSSSNVEKGLMLLKSIVSMLADRSWDACLFEESLNHWVTLLVYSIDLVEHESRSHINQLFSVSLWDSYNICLNQALKDVFSRQCHKLSPAAFNSFISIEGFDKTEIIKMYLKIVKVSDDVAVLKEPMRTLLCLTSNHLIPTGDQDRVFQSFCDKIMTCYERSERSAKFIEDILQLDIASTEKFEEIFIDSLKKFIRRNELLKALNDIFSTFNEISIKEDSFHQAVIEVMIEETFSFIAPSSDVIKSVASIITDQLFSSEADFCSIKIRTTLKIFLYSFKYIKRPLESITCLRDHSEILFTLTQTISAICTSMSLQEFEEATPLSSDIIESVRMKLQPFVSRVCSLMETKEITFGHLEILNEHHETYESIYRCVSMFFVECEDFVKKEDVEKAKECVLKIQNLLVKFPRHYPQLGGCHVKIALSKNGIELPAVLNTLIDRNLAASSDNGSSGHTGQMKVSLPVFVYKARDESTLSSLESIARHLDEFLQPISDSLDMLVFLEWKKCQTLQKSIDYFLSSSQSLDCDIPKESTGMLEVGFPADVATPFVHHRRHFSDPKYFDICCNGKMIKLNEAVKKADKFVLALIEDSAIVQTIKQIFSMDDFSTIDWSEENVALRDYYKLKVGSCEIDVCKRLHVTFELLDACEYIFAMKNICKELDLQQSLADMTDLIKRVNHVKLTSITTCDAQVFVDDIKGFFRVDNIGENPCFCLFKQGTHLCKLHQFAIERGYDSIEHAIQIFRQEHQLVTTELLHEEHNVQLLSMLQNTMNLIFPFLKKETSILELWNDIRSVNNLTDAMSHLPFVIEGIGIIRMWFNRTHGEIPKNNEILLKNILVSGVFQFSFNSDTSVNLTLEFTTADFTRGMYATLSINRLSQVAKWPLSKINDFSRQISCMKFENETFSGIGSTWFKEFKRLAIELLRYYSQLLYRGHPDYRKMKLKEFPLNPEFQEWRARGCWFLPSQWSDGWKCVFTSSWEVLNNEVENSKKVLQKFVQKFESSRENYPVLSFVSTNKLYAVYEKLVQEFIDPAMILREVGFLFQLDINSCSQLEKTIESISPVYIQHQNLHPAEVVGEFLQSLIKNSEIQLCLSSCIISQPMKKSASVEINLISALNFTNLDLMNLSFWIFKKIPCHFQLLRLSLSTTEEDIDIFFDRILHFPQSEYLIMGVNVVRNELQRVILRRCSKLRSTILSGSATISLKVFLVEYSPSLFRHISWIEVVERLSTDDLRDKCKAQRIGKAFKKFEVVYGISGCGKTHYIRKKIKCHEEECKKSKKHYDSLHMSISINETFKRSEILKHLTSVPLNRYDMLYYFNVSLFLPHGNDKEEYKKKFYQLVDDVNWFFFDYFILGYVEVPDEMQQLASSCSCSQCLCSGISTAVYVEVPYWNVNGNLDDSFKKFEETLPSLTFLGTKVIPPMSFDVTQYDGAQLVCKYLLASEEEKLDRQYTERSDKAPAIRINELYTDMTPETCSEILQRRFPRGIIGSRILEGLYLRYMEKRCRSLENCPYLLFLEGGNYDLLRDEEGKAIEDLNLTNMRSTLFQLMNEEVQDFCSNSILQATDQHQQVIYDIDQDGGIVFRFFCTGLPTEEKLQKLKAIGVKLKTMNNQMFHDCLSAALNVKKDENNKISLIKENKFVLTKDFVRKMLNIHERRECGMPVIIEGETGVGKTFLLQMLSLLWNDSWKQQLDHLRSNFESLLNEKLSKVSTAIGRRNLRSSNLILSVKTALANGEKVSYKALCDVLSLEGLQYPLYITLKNAMKIGAYDPVIASIELPADSNTERGLIDYLLQMEKPEFNAEAMAHIVNGILYGTLKDVFYKKSIHSAMKPEEIEEFLRSINQHAETLLQRYKKYKMTIQEPVVRYQKPIVTVFFDEINTSFCPGYLKEIIIDRTVNGRPLSENIFIVAACNPHRGNSLASLAKSDDKWLNTAYYVQSLPHTLSLLKWDYGQLRMCDEIDYIREKLHLSYEGKEMHEYEFLTRRISSAQQLIRDYAYDHLKGLVETNKSKVREKIKSFSRSTVSQRDIQRVFTLYAWLENWFQKPSKYGNKEDKFHIRVRAVFVAMALVYYLRLDEKCRRDFRAKIFIEHSVGTSGIPPTFEKSLRDELDWVSCVIDLPTGVAPTDALRENIYAIIVCTMARIPVLIVGPPGSSKTLSFKIVIENCQGKASKHEELKDLTIFKSLDPHPYQCSRKSTSTEVETVFQRATIRQNTVDPDYSQSLAVVLMDEAGLPEDSHESLKCLHYLLDVLKVSFVGISNEVLDAAKTNRTVTIYRAEISGDDLNQLARYSLTSGKLPEVWNEDEEKIIDGFVSVYKAIMSDKPHIRNFFGLRDFIHFFTYLGRAKSHLSDVITPQSVIEALEHNFNGTKDFNRLVQMFFKALGSSPENTVKRSLIQILQSSFQQDGRDLSSENQVRYKLFFDSSEDQSLIRLLFRFGILKRDSTKILSCSRFPGDSDSQKLYTTIAIRHAARQGDTIIIHQAEEIQESFYDLFNQRFTVINNTTTGQKLLYANVAIGTVIKPTIVSPSFKCAVIINSSEKSTTKKPFLNRFEKYDLNHSLLFKEALSCCSDSIETLMINAKERVLEFVTNCEESSFYGLVDQTVDSLMLSVMPRYDREEKRPVPITQCECDSQKDCLAKCLQHQFQLAFGVYIDLGHCSEFSDAVSFALTKVPLDQDIDELLDASTYSDMMKMAEMTVKCLEDSSPVTKFSLLLLQELLVVYLCQQLIYLMTPEALVLCSTVDENNSMINYYYRNCYIYNQHHFSLGSLISKEYILLDNRDSFVVRKFLCYTRTSQGILELIPGHYNCRSSQASVVQELNPLQDFLQIDKSKRIHTYIINNTTSQEMLVEVLQSFFNCSQSECRTEVLMLVADMNESSKETVSHARLLIEEEELSCRLQSNKLVFLLVHFPSNMFYSHCYPSLFLEGWQHMYVGRVGEMKDECSIDIKKWLSVCLLPERVSSLCESLHQHEPLVNDYILIKWMISSTLMISNSVAIKQLKDFPPPFADVDIIRFYWVKILQDDHIRNAIIARFNTFWQQEAIHRLTHQIAHYAMTYQSSCTLSKTIQETVRSSFYELVLFFLCILNQKLALHTILHDSTNTDAKIRLVCKILSVLPIPQSLQQLQLDVNILIQQSRRECVMKDISSPHFPFFPLIFDEMEIIVSKAFREVVHSMQAASVDVCESQTMETTDINADLVIKEIVKLVNEPTDERPEFLAIEFAIQAMSEDSRFWDYYLEDAKSNKLMRDVGVFSKPYFSSLSDIQSSDIITQLAHLHYQLRVYWLDSHCLSSLRLLDECVSIATMHGVSDMKEYAKVDVHNKVVVFSTAIDIMYTSLMRPSDDDQLAKLKVEELSHLYYRMINQYKNVAGLSVSVNNKWSVLCVVFYIYHLPNRQDILSVTFEDFVWQMNEMIAVESRYLKANELADVVTAIVCEQRDCVIEQIIEHYVEHSLDSITDEEINWICSVLNIVQSVSHSHSSEQHLTDECDQLKIKYRYHLLVLLDKHKRGAESLSIHEAATEHPNPLRLFDDRVRLILSNLIDSQSPPNCFKYYPSNYIRCSTLRHTDLVFSSSVSLCDTYYELVMQKLERDDRSLSEMVSFYKQISNDIIAAKTCQSIKKLLAIEKQAVIQVATKRLAYIVQDDARSAGELSLLEETDINDILNDNTAVSKSNPAITDNALTFVMRLLQKCKDERQLKVMLVDHFHVVGPLNTFHCLHHINSAIKVQRQHCEHFLPFLGRYCSDRMSIYNRVFSVMKKIIRYSGRQGVDNMHRMGLECYSPSDKTGMKKWAFNMSIFLSAHAQFFLIKRNSTILLPILSQVLIQYIGDQYWSFVEWMINPTNGITQHHTSFQDIRDFFSSTDEANANHIQCLIELAAVVLGSPESSSHWWTHLIKPNSIRTDFLPGSLVTDSNKNYIDVTSIEEDSDSIIYTHRNSLNPLSLLVLQWTNFGLLCMSMIKGPLSAQCLPSSSEVLDQLNMLWEKVAVGCNLTFDERDSLLFFSVQNIYKVLQDQLLTESWSILTNANASRDQHFNALCQYEQIIHTEVFIPAWRSVKSSECFAQFGDPLARHMRELRRNVPQLNIQCNDLMKGFLGTILSSTKLQDESCPLVTIYQFVLARPALNVGAILLPKLVDIYCWIHSQLLYKVTIETAKRESVSTGLELILEQFPTQRTDKSRQMEEIISQYKLYKKLVPNSSQLPDIDPNMKFNNLLSCDGSKDVLYKAIIDIVKRYNDFLHRHKPKKINKSTGIPLIEVTEESCLFYGSQPIANYEELKSYRNLEDLRGIVMKYSIVGSSKRQYSSDPTIVQDYVPQVFYLDKIQEEVIKHFIAHKQVIVEEKIWKEFQFFTSQYNEIPQSLFYTLSHYTETIAVIEKDYSKLARTDIEQGVFEETFHSLTYDCLLSVCSGLYLILQMIVQIPPNSDELDRFSDQTVLEFLNRHPAKELDPAKELGIMRKSPDNVKSGLDDYQYEVIFNIRLNEVVFLSTFFQKWLEIGFYDFCHLPFCMKIRLCDETIPVWIQDHDNNKLVTDVLSILFKSEQDLLKAAVVNSDTAIGEVVKNPAIPVCINETPVKHYVYIQLELRKRLLEKEKSEKLNAQLSIDERTPSPLPVAEQTESMASPAQRFVPSPIPPKNPVLHVVQPQQLETDTFLRNEAQKRSHQDVVDFITREGFESIADIVSEVEDFDGLVVFDMLPNDDDLSREFGLNSAIDQLRFRVLFKRWLANSVSKLGMISPENVAKCFSSHRLLSHSSEEIIERKIDGEMLQQANAAALAELNIHGFKSSIVQKVVKEMENMTPDDTQ